MKVVSCPTEWRWHRRWHVRAHGSYCRDGSIGTELSKRRVNPEIETYYLFKLFKKILFLNERLGINTTFHLWSDEHSIRFHCFENEVDERSCTVQVVHGQRCQDGIRCCFNRQWRSFDSSFLINFPMFFIAFMKKLVIWWQSSSNFFASKKKS